MSSSIIITIHLEIPVISPREVFRTLTIDIRDIAPTKPDSVAVPSLDVVNPSGTYSFHGWTLTIVYAADNDTNGLSGVGSGSPGFLDVNLIYEKSLTIVDGTVA